MCFFHFNQFLPKKNIFLFLVFLFVTFYIPIAQINVKHDIYMYT